MRTIVNCLIVLLLLLCEKVEAAAKPLSLTYALSTLHTSLKNPLLLIPPSYVPLKEQRTSSLSDTTPIRPNTYVLEINKYTSNAYRGYLQGISDTALQVTQNRSPFGKANVDKSFSYHEIEKLTVHRMGSAGRGAATGAIGGALLGALIGAITYQPCTNCFLDFGAGFNILTGAGIGIPLGAGLGIALGSRKNKFNINRTRGNFDEMRTQLFRRYGNTAKKG
jgi:hypothetical protein